MTEAERRQTGCRETVGAVLLTLAASVVCWGVTGIGQTLSRDGLYTEAQADRGSVEYQETCEGCHAPDLSGGKVVPEMVGDGFAARWTGQTVGQLLERITVSMPVDDPSRVSRRDKRDILAFILRANGLPSGDQELSERPHHLTRPVFEVAIR